MKTRLMTVAVAALLAAAGSFAQAADQNVTINASVSSFCSISSSANTTQTVATNGSGHVTGMSGSPPSITFTCNAASNVALTSTNGAITLGGFSEGSLSPAPFGFSNKIEYTASVTGDGSPVSLDTTSAVSASGSFYSGAAATTTSVTITPIDPTNPLLASGLGSYSDTLVVAINPA